MLEPSVLRLGVQICRRSVHTSRPHSSRLYHRGYLQYREKAPLKCAGTSVIQSQPRRFTRTAADRVRHMSTKDGPQNSWAQRDYENGIRAKDGQGIVDEDGNVVLPAAPIPIPAGYSDLKAPSSIEELMGLEGTMKQKRYANIPYKDVALFYPKASNSKEDFWYVIVAVALMAMGRQHLIATLWRHLSDAFIKQMETEEAVPLSGEKVRAGAAGKAQDEGKGGSQESIEDLVWKSKRLREGILKASVLVGFPRAINALSTLYRVQAASEFDPDLTGSQPPLREYLRFQQTAPNTAIQPTEDISMLDPEEPTPEDTGTNPSYSRGLDLFIKLYTPETASRIVYSMEETNCSPDLPNFAISRIYGDLLSETSIISEKETGLIAMASCLSLAVATDEPEVGLDAQVKGHMYGAKNLGASGQEIRGVVRTISAIFRTIRDRNHKVVKDAAKVGRDEKEGYTKWMPKDWGHPLTKVLLQAKGWDAEKIIHGQPRYKPRARFHSNLRDWRKGTKNKSK